ncbi:ARMT1-like domain-containing protein [Thermodesulfobium sp. 4217-1]|uniref:damage-control phosphatase ARMT1 family protein n=1 Tax=Thermodesulfobium sp. 4217-1 TaxID=3120013 RepID=UPI003221FA6B
MKLCLDCIVCFQKQALFATKDLDDSLRAKILKKVMLFLCDADWETSPDEFANEVHCIIREVSGLSDPYKEIKKNSNKISLEMYPELKELLDREKLENRLYTAVKLAIAGNIIDFGPSVEFDLKGTVNEVMYKDLAIDDFKILQERIIASERLLYFADNAGEIAFDKIFIEEMLRTRKRPFKQISFVVKSGPIINDAMLGDACDVGIDRLPNIRFLEISNGEKNSAPSRRSDEVRRYIEEHDIVISKGQGNFEGLSDYSNIFFMLMAKCPVISNELMVDIRSSVIKYKE